MIKNAVGAPAPKGKATTTRAVRGKRKRRGWKFYTLIAFGSLFLLLSSVTVFYYVKFARMIDARLHGEFARADPRVFGRPFEVRRGQAVTPQQLIDRLNDIGYTDRARAEQPGEFTVGKEAILVIPREGTRRGQLLRIAFTVKKGKAPSGIDHILALEKKERLDAVKLDAPLITALISTGREKRRDVPLAAIPERMVKAVLAIEDRRFYEHPGIDPIGIIGAVWEYATGGRARMRGASTLTQQLIKNTFLSPDRSPTRKFKEWIMSIALERRLSKDQVLELYLNDINLGQRGSFGIIGVPEAARLFFGKDIANVSLAEAATIAGVIQSPPRHSPFLNPNARRSAATSSSQRWQTRDSLRQTRPAARAVSRSRSPHDRSRTKPPTSSITSGRSCRTATRQPVPSMSTRHSTCTFRRSPRTRYAKA